MKRVLLLLAAAALMCACAAKGADLAASDSPKATQTSEAVIATQSPSAHRIVGYLYADSIADADTLSGIDFTLISHINYAFALVDKDTLLPYLDERSAEAMALLREELARQNASPRVLLSIGGWGCDNFCFAAQDDAHRRAFAGECLALCEEYGFDGVDIDWEYPVNGGWGEISTLGATDRTNYTLLFQAIRDAIGEQRLLTIAFAPQLLGLIEGEKVCALCDFVNIMAYDYTAECQADLRTTEVSMPFWEKCVKDSTKLVLGVPFYSRSTDGEYDRLSYSRLLERIQSEGLKVRRNASESFIDLGLERVSFDSPGMLREKAKWVRERGYGGIMIWELTQDRDSDLLRSIYSALNGDGAYESKYLREEPEE